MPLTSGPKTQKELLLELEPVVEKEVNRHLTMAKEWFPHEYVPYSEGRTYSGVLGGEGWDRGIPRSRLSPATRCWSTC
jgi:Fatty acid desaturase.